MWTEFRKFISRGNVIDLAIGIIIGSAFTAIVNSLVNDIMMPPIGWLMGDIDFSHFYLNLSDESYPNLAAAQAAGAPTINYGMFINNVIKFFIVGFAVFLLVQQMNRLWKREQEKPTTPPRQEQLLEEIRDLLRARQP